MMDFPANPVPGQKYNPGNGSIYTWDGVAWNLAPVNVATARSRNRVNNPTAQVSQELGDSGSVATAAYLADQWQLNSSGIVSSGFRNSGVSAPEGTSTAVGITATTAKPSLAAGDILVMSIPIEGLDIADLQWGTALAQPIVLRFAVYSDTAGTFPFQIRNGAGDRVYLGSYTVAAAVWQTVSVAVPGDTTGTWRKDNGIGIILQLGHSIGSTYVGVAGWQAGNKLAPPGCTNGAAVANKYLFVTNVGIYADPDRTGIAPPFEAPCYEDDLARCMRYWELVQHGGIFAYGPAGQSIGSGLAFKARKRVIPSCAITGWQGAGNVSGQAVNNVSTDGYLFTVVISATGGGYMSGVTSTASARLI